MGHGMDEGLLVVGNRPVCADVQQVVAIARHARWDGVAAGVDAAADAGDVIGLTTADLLDFGHVNTTL